MTRIITLRQALTDNTYFGSQLSGESWANWRTLLLAILGEPLEPDELERFTALTGRAQI